MSPAKTWNNFPSMVWETPPYQTQGPWLIISDATFVLLSHKRILDSAYSRLYAPHGRAIVSAHLTSFTKNNILRSFADLSATYNIPKSAFLQFLQILHALNAGLAYCLTQWPFISEIFVQK